MAHELRAPDAGAVLVATTELKHPMLRPLPVDLGRPLSPDELAVLAVVVNPLLRASRDKRSLASAQLIQAGLLPNPTLSASVDFPSFGTTDGEITAFGTGLTWEITSLITRGAAIDAASAEAASVSLDVAWQEWQAAMAAKLHATRVLHLGEQVSAAEHTRDDAAHAADLVREAARQGLLTRLELDAADAEAHKVMLGLLEIESTLESERLALNLAVGLPADVRVEVRPGPPADPGPLSPGDIARRIETGRLDLLALRMGYQSQEHKLREAVLSQFPKISVGLTAARDTGNVGTLGFGIDIELPLFDRAQGRIAVETATRRQLFDEYVSRTFEARSEAARLVSELASVRRQISASVEYVARLESLAHSYEGATRTGGLDALSLYQARATLAEARLGAAHLRQQEDELLVGLEAALGRPSEEPRP